MIKYQLFKNNLTADAGDYMARIKPGGSADLDAVIAHMVQQKGPTAVRSEVLSTLDDFFGAVEALLARGYNVNTPLANFHLSIRGKFAGQNDGFDPGRHLVTTQVCAGARLRKSLPGLVQMAKQPLQPLTPSPEAYFDAGSDTQDQFVTPRSIGKVTGYYLRFAPRDDPTLGVFFVATAGGETRVTTYSENLPGRLHFLVPDLAPGEYRLEVRTRHEDDDVRQGVLKAILTVQP